MFIFHLLILRPSDKRECDERSKQQEQEICNMHTKCWSEILMGTDSLET